MDVALTLTYKFSKRVKIIPGKNIQNAVDWVYAVFTIIVDRDSKQLLEFWRIIFFNMGITIAITTAYHLQADN